MIPPSVFERSFITHTKWTNSYTLGLSKLLLASSLLSLSSKQSITTTSNQSPILRTRTHQQLNIPIKCPQFLNPPYYSHDEIRKPYLASPHSITTIKGTRDGNIPQIYFPAISYNPTLTQKFT